MNSLSIVSIRVLAIYLIVKSLNTALPILAVPESWGDIAEIKYQILIAYVFIPVVTGTALWILSPAISKRLNPEHGSSNSSLQEVSLVRAGSFLIGIYYFVDTVPTIFYRYYEHQTLALEMIATAILSCALILGFKFIGSLFQRIQNDITKQEN